MRILAFNTAHDASVCSLNDGEIEFFSKEERLTRKKRDKNPFKSLELYHSLNFGQIDYVVYCNPSSENKEEVQYKNLYKTYFMKKFGVNENQILSLTHHICHAFLSFINSEFDDALVFVVDRNGTHFCIGDDPVARESESVYVFNKKTRYREIYKSFWLSDNHYSKEQIRNRIKNIFPSPEIKIHNAYGIVKVYEAATTLIGQHPLENGKTMGLASYGEDKNYVKLFLDNTPIENYFDHVSGKVIFNNLNEKIVKHVDENDYQFYANQAKHVQIETQRAVLDLIKKYVDCTKIKNVCLVGGYALNIVANNYYLKNLPDVNFYFEPNADDSGISIGATMAAYRRITNKWSKPLTNNFYHYYNVDEQIQSGNISSIDEICELLIAQKSVAVFEGSPEAGPRALGHRSILFDPRNIDAKKIINKIKKREWYRPFAGVILESYFDQYFETFGLKSSPYMTVNFDCKEIAKRVVPGIIHVDDTCRIQTINSGFLFDLLQLFYEKTGCPMLLNTSFNLAGEPLVQTKADAIKTFENSELDAVYFVEEGRILTKSK